MSFQWKQKLLRKKFGKYGLMLKIGKIGLVVLKNAAKGLPVSVRKLIDMA